MKRLLTILCLVLLVSCSNEVPTEVTPQPLEVVTGPFLVRDGITYDQNTNEPFTGIVEEFHENGQLMGRGNFIDGKREGLKEVFYRNGQLQYRGNHIDGEIDGLSESFHGNGQLRWRTNYIDGKLEGPLEYFDRNGNLTKTETYRNGVLVE